MLRRPGGESRSGNRSATVASGEVRAFLSAWVRHPVRMGAVAPSSRGLAELLASVVPATGAPVVVELGPGTGAITDAIERRLPAGAAHLAVDANPAMVAYLRRRCPGVDAVVGDAAELGVLLEQRCMDGVDAVVSGLPWALFTPTAQGNVLSQIADALRPDGVFATFAYSVALPLPAAQRFRRRLQSNFDDVVRTKTVWRNLPPAFGYVCRRPLRMVQPHPPAA